MRTVLVVDGDAATAAMLATLLRDEGLAPITSTSLRDVRELARRDLPHAIVFDVPVPQRACWDALRALGDDPTTRAIPILLMTTDRDAIATMRSTAPCRLCGIVSKPFDIAELLSQLRHALEAQPCDARPSLEYARDPATGVGSKLGRTRAEVGT